jgi:hypothetical protein
MEITLNSYCCFRLFYCIYFFNGMLKSPPSRSFSLPISFVATAVPVLGNVGARGGNVGATFLIGFLLSLSLCSTVEERRRLTKRLDERDSGIHVGRTELPQPVIR